MLVPKKSTVTVTDVGSRPGDELVQLYLTEVEATVRVPIRSLQGIQRIHPAPARGRELSFTLEPRQLAIIDDSGASVVEPEEFSVTVGWQAARVHGPHRCGDQIRHLRGASE